MLRLGYGFDARAHAQVPLALEIGRAIEAETRGEQAPLRRRERLLHRLALPDVEAAFVAFRVGVQARVQRAVAGVAIAAARRAAADLAQHPVHGARDGVGE